MSFAEKIREARRGAGLSQAKLAEMADISTRTLQNYELGKRYPSSIEITVRLAKALGTSAQDLLSAGEEAVVAAPDHAKRQLEALVRDMKGLFAGGALCEEDRDAAMEAIIAAYWQAKKENRKYAPAAKGKAKNEP